jgi:hypothetical protein
MSTNKGVFSVDLFADSTTDLVATNLESETLT